MPIMWFQTFPVRVTEIDGTTRIAFADLLAVLSMKQGGALLYGIGDEGQLRVRVLDGKSLKGHGLKLLSAEAAKLFCSRAKHPNALALLEWIEGLKSDQGRPS